MPLINNLYVQSLTAPLLAQDTEDPILFERKISKLAHQISSADAVVVGIGSGMSSAAGYDFYHEDERFDQAFSQFERSHGFNTLFDGLYHVFGSNEEHWAFNAAVTQYVCALEVGKPYLDLARVLEGVEHFVITTNIDGQASKVFDKNRLFLFQGDMRYWQCSQPCSDEIVDGSARAAQLVATMVHANEGAPRIDYDSLPRCQACGHLMTPWVRDTNFLEGSFWHKQERHYLDFLEQHLVDRHDKVLFLELGVSSMTPAIIKLPFWSMCSKNPQTEYVCVNKGESSLPMQLQSRATAITADLAQVMSALAGRLTYS